MGLPRPTLIALCVPLALLAGCGDDDSTPVARGPGTVVMTDYAFDPGEVRVRRGGTLTVVNDGGIAHNLTIEKGPDPREETDELAGTSSFLKGDSEELRVDLPAGRYAMVCTVPGHRELGMVGSVTVR